MRGKNNFRKNDLVRACRSLEEAGLRLRAVAFEPGKFTVLVGETAAASDGDKNPWDEVFDGHAKNQERPA